MWPTNTMSPDLPSCPKSNSQYLNGFTTNRRAYKTTKRNSVLTRKHVQPPSALVDSPQSVVSRSTAPTVRTAALPYSATASNLTGRLIATGCCARLRCCRPQVLSLLLV